MSGARHPNLSDFAARREQRQLYARDTRLSGDASLRFIREGEAERLRAECRAGTYICPVPGCTDPRYTTVGGSRRDHFRHMAMTGGVHAPETYFHYTGKHVVGAWARRQYPESTVHVDDRHVRSDSGTLQVPDVLVDFPDGRRFAFEVQYAPMTMPEWQRRHNGYASQGIVDLWLWGHEPRYLRRAKDHHDRIALGPVPFAARRAGAPLHWINPDDGLIATCRDASDPWTEAERRHGRRGKPQWESVSLAFEPLADCRIEGDRFVTPLQRHEVENRSEIARDILKARNEERRERDARVKAQADEARRREERRAYAQKKADEEYERDVRPAVARRFAGAIDVIEVSLQWDRAIYRSPFQWHAKLWELFVEDHIGEVFSFEDVERQLLDRLDGRVDDMPMAAYGYLMFIQERGYLECRIDDRRLIREIIVLADAAHPPGTPGAIAPKPSTKAAEAAGVDRPRRLGEWTELGL